MTYSLISHFRKISALKIINTNNQKYIFQLKILLLPQNNFYPEELQINAGRRRFPLYFFKDRSRLDYTRRRVFLFKATGSRNGADRLRVHSRQKQRCVFRTDSSARFLLSRVSDESHGNDKSKFFGQLVRIARVRLRVAGIVGEAVV